MFKLPKLAMPFYALALFSVSMCAQAQQEPPIFEDQFNGFLDFNTKWAYVGPSMALAITSQAELRWLMRPSSKPITAILSFA